jgi:hypothetical protein
MIRFSSQTRIKLWQLLVAIAVLAVVLGLLPQHVGIPVFFVIEGTLIIALLFFLVVAVFRKAAKK